jgi:TolA-binding protein
MALGGATKKLQKVADMGEELYARLNELREQIVEMRVTVQDTNERVRALENKVDQQGAILEALAEDEGIDVDAILTEVAIEEAEPAITEADANDATDGADAAGAGSSSPGTDASTDASDTTDDATTDGPIDEAGDADRTDR